jgi:ferredoxin--NADP+ reductase
MTAWTEGKLIAKKYWNDNLFSLHIQATVPAFEAGQFTKIALDIDEQRIGRPYSFVNAPHESYLEFYVVTVPEGALSPKLLALKEGDSIWVQTRPVGFFVLSEVPQGKNLWMLASGTALGVFLSILKTATPWERFEKIVLCHAVRQAESLSHHDLIEEFKAKYPSQFQFVPFVSREVVPNAFSGRITTALENGSLEAHTGLMISPEDSQVMICGNPEMVKESMMVLQAKGLKKHTRKEAGHITIENYWK